MHRLKNDDGAVAVLVAIAMVALLGMSTIVLDVGQLYAERRQLQNGADAAVLALAPDCATTAGCSTNLSPGGLAGVKADQNASESDGLASVTEICGNASSLVPCSPASAIGPWDCAPLAAGPLSSAKYVQVRTATRQAGGGNLLPPTLARVLDPSYDGTTVRACARASWGGAGAMQSNIPLTISVCEFDDLVGNPPSSFAPGPPYPPAVGGSWPAVSWEKTLYFHDTTEASANDCPAGPSGGDDPISGGFGWLQSTNCVATSSVTGWFDTAPGASPGSDCRANELDDMLGKLAYIPVYDRTNGLNGANGQYGIKGYAAFVLTGYNLGGSYKEESLMSGAPNVFPCANDPTTGSQRCISGFFTQNLTPTSGVIGGPLLGAPPIIQLSG